MNITDDIKYVGVFDTKTDLFEGQYVIPDGISYNSYVIIDEKIAVTDTVDGGFTRQWLDNIKAVLGGRSPDYLVVHHMEPDHAASIVHFASTYPDAKIVASKKAFSMMNNFFGTDFAEKQIVADEGDTLTLGKHTLTFLIAPMVHWPEVIVSYDSADKVLFSADGFGRFGNPYNNESWADEARRYYIGIVGKYGAHVQALLKKAAALDIKIICPLHGPVLKDNLSYYIGLYDKWSSYTAEADGVLVAYTSVYGNTKAAAIKLFNMLKEKGVDTDIYDLARCDMPHVVAEAFKYNRLAVAATTYNGDIFPPMREFLTCLAQRNYQNRTVGIIENGSWAPVAADIIKKRLSGLNNIKFLQPEVTIMSALNEQSQKQLEALALELVK